MENFIWAEMMGGPGTDIPKSIFVDNDLKIYITGQFSQSADFDPGPDDVILTSNGEMDAFFVKLSQGVTGIVEFDRTHSISLYPNPSNGIVTFNFEQIAHIHPVILEIYNLLLQRVCSIPITNQSKQITKDLNLKSGTYFYQVLTNSLDEVSGSFVIIE